MEIVRRLNPYAMPFFLAETRETEINRDIKETICPCNINENYKYDAEKGSNTKKNET